MQTRSIKVRISLDTFHKRWELRHEHRHIEIWWQRGDNELFNFRFIFAMDIRVFQLILVVKGEHINMFVNKRLSPRFECFCMDASLTMPKTKRFNIKGSEHSYIEYNCSPPSI